MWLCHAKNYIFSNAIDAHDDTLFYDYGNGYEVRNRNGAARQDGMIGSLPQ